MKVLFIAPQPFYTQRGTPIAVDLLLRVLSERGEKVDLVTYHLGENVEYENIRIYRIPSLPFIQIIPPGFSIQKSICDIFLFWKVIFMVSGKRYHIVHAVEEAVLVAYLVNKLWGIEYIYDMDSNLPDQMLAKFPFLKPIASFFRHVERLMVRNAVSVVPVNQAMVENLGQDVIDKVTILHDVSLLKDLRGEKIESIRHELGISGLLVMYAGNLEKYQGIDLLLEGFALVNGLSDNINLVIIGGGYKDVQGYELKSRELGINDRVSFLGPKPVNNLGWYLSEADILVSPRISGDNTPMKIYSYLESGKAIIATNLRSHTQVLDDNVALLVSPNPKAFGQGMRTLAEDEGLREELGRLGKKLIEEKYSFENFRASVNLVYDSLVDLQPR